MSNILDFALRNSWAMDPGYLQKMFGVLYRHADGQRLSKQEIEAAIGRPIAGFYSDKDEESAPKPPPPYTLNGGTATIQVYGVICKRSASVSNISGPSGISTETIRQNIQAALSDPKVKRILLDVDSPGGSVDGVADLSDFIYSKRGVKPMIAFANGQMASAAYFIASAADHIVCSQDAAVGSIGVYSILQDLSQYLKNAGINEEMIKAGKYKGLGHPDFPITPDTRKVAQAEVDKHYDNFVKAIARNRGMSVEDATKIADGRCHIGDDAVDLGLADEVSSFDAVVSGKQTVSPTPDSPKKIKPVTSESPVTSVSAFAEIAPSVLGTNPIVRIETKQFQSLCVTADRVLAVRFDKRGDAKRNITMSENAAPTAPASKVVSFRDLSVEDVKSENPELYQRIGRDFVRAQKDHESKIQGMIRESGCDEATANALFVSCKDMDEKNAKIEINRVCGIEAALASAKIAGLDDEDLKYLRAECRDMTQMTATRHIQGFVHAKTGAKARLVTSQDPAVTGADKPKEETKAADEFSKVVAAGREEFKKNFGDPSKSIMGLTEKDYVQQYLDEKGIEYTDASLKSVAPDLFK